MLGRLTLIVLAIALLPALPAGEARTLADTVLANGTFVIDEPLVVPEGTTLTIRDATVYLDWRGPCLTGTVGYCQPQIEVAGGRLVVQRSTITTSSFDGSANSGWAIVGVGGVLDVTDSRLERFRILSAQEPADAPSRIEANVFQHGGTAILIHRGADATIEDNLVEDVGDGIVVRDTLASVEGNTVRRAAGFGIRLDASSVGEKIYDTLPRVEGNLVESSSVGLVWLGGFPVEIESNVLRDNGKGALIAVTVGDDAVHKLGPHVRLNRFEGNGDAVHVSFSGAVRLTAASSVDLTRNSYVGSACHDVVLSDARPRITIDVDARHGWWGSAAGPQDKGLGCEAVVGPVAVAPWATSAP